MVRSLSCLGMFQFEVEPGSGTSRGTLGVRMVSGQVPGTGCGTDCTSCTVGSSSPGIRTTPGFGDGLGSEDPSLNFARGKPALVEGMLGHE